jgi:hypothetical protein
MGKMFHEIHEEREEAAYQRGLRVGKKEGIEAMRDAAMNSQCVWYNPEAREDMKEIADKLLSEVEAGE